MMIYILPIILGLSLLAGILAVKPSPVPAQEQRVSADVAKYRLFMMATDAYFIANAAPAATTAYTWTTLKAGAPVALQNTGMPPQWKAVRRADGEWVACTELDQPSVSGVQSFFKNQTTMAGAVKVPLLPVPVPAASVPTVVGTGGTAVADGIPTYIVMGQDGVASATSANLCSQY